MAQTTDSAKLYEKVQQAQRGEINSLEVLHIDSPGASFTPLPTAANKPPERTK